ncbi:class I SAM-dependent RNA methyltransferase [soil metagenome]
MPISSASRWSLGVVRSRNGVVVPKRQFPGYHPGVADPGDPTVTITMHGWAHGGDAVGRLPDGRACFVPFTLPGERVEVNVRRLYKRHATADLVRVIEESPHRVQPPCPYYGDCGGCQLQHIAPAHQLQLKAQVLTEQLQRIGKVADPPVRGVRAPSGPWPSGYRAWARMAVDDEGRLGFRRARSHDVIPIDACLLLDRRTQAVRDAVGDGWTGAEEVTLTTGADDAVVAVAGAPDLASLPEGPFGLVVGADRSTSDRGPDKVTIMVLGHALQASAGTFFQAGPGCAESLVTAVMDVTDVGPGDTVWDLYAGGGLLSVFLAAAGASVTAVEADPVACADATANLAEHNARVITSTVEKVLPQLLVDTVDVIVLDPPRRGANADVCRTIAKAGARQIVYVACDPAALSRDTVTLRDEGYDLTSVDGLDLFGHTAHVEAVAVFRPHLSSR